MVTLSKKKGKDNLTIRQRRAFKELAVNGGTKAAALRKAGYSEEIAKNPQKVFNNQTYVQILERAGLTDESLAKAHQELMQSSRIEKYSFLAARVEKWVKLDKKGRKLKTPYKDLGWKHLSDEEITVQIANIPGHRLMYIQKGLNEKIAYCQVPENAVRKSAIEMANKVKGHFAPDKLEVVEHTVSPEEAAALEKLFGSK